MSSILQFTSIASFFLVYKLYDIFLATGVALFFYTLYMIFNHVKKSATKFSYISYFLFLFLGIITILLKNEIFIQWKVTVLSLGIGAGIYISKYLFKIDPMKEFFNYSSDSMNKYNKKYISSFNLNAKDYSLLNHILAITFILKGIVNYYVMTNYSLDSWVYFKTFIIPLMSIVSFFSILFMSFKGFKKENP